MVTINNNNYVSPNSQYGVVNTIDTSESTKSDPTTESSVSEGQRIVSTKQHELKQEYAEKQADLKKRHIEKKQKLDQQYSQGKQKLQTEYRQESLDISIYA